MPGRQAAGIDPFCSPEIRATWPTVQEDWATPHKGPAHFLLLSGSGEFSRLRQRGFVCRGRREGRQQQGFSLAQEGLPARPSHHGHEHLCVVPDWVVNGRRFGGAFEDLVGHFLGVRRVPALCVHRPAEVRTQIVAIDRQFLPPDAQSSMPRCDNFERPAGCTTAPE